MQIEQFEVTGLFGRFRREIPFTTTHVDAEDALSLVILHGLNGSGKTTALRMLDGFMKLDFDAFRSVEFDRAQLRFSTDLEITVASTETRRGAPGLRVAFDEHEVVLDGQLGEKGPADRRDRNKVEDFRTHFFDETRSIQLEYIHVDRSAGPSKVSGEYQYHTSALGEIVWYWYSPETLLGPASTSTTRPRSARSSQSLMAVGDARAPATSSSLRRFEISFVKHR